MSVFRKTKKRIRFEEGLAFHKRSLAHWFWLVPLTVANGVYFWLMVSRAVDGGALFVWRDLLILFPAGFLVVLLALWWIIPIVRVTADGLRVRGKLVRFEEIRSIDMEEKNSRFAVLTVGENRRISLYNQQDWEQSSFDGAITDLANKAGVKIIYTDSIR